MQTSVPDIDECFQRIALSYPDHLALTDGERSVSWGALDRSVNRLANELIKRGISPGQSVAALGRNSIEYVLLFFAVLRAGGCMVPLSTLASGAALAGMVNDSGAKLLFVSKAYEDLIDRGL